MRMFITSKTNTYQMTWNYWNMFQSFNCTCYYRPLLAMHCRIQSMYCIHLTTFCILELHPHAYLVAGCMTRLFVAPNISIWSTYNWTIKIGALIWVHKLLGMQCLCNVRVVGALRKGLPVTKLSYQVTYSYIKNGMLIYKAWVQTTILTCL